MCIRDRDSIDSLYERGIKAGAIGGKLLGAGGGGFLVFYAEKDIHDRIIKAMSDLMYIPFEFENSGTKIIHYTPESFASRTHKMG